MDEVVHDEHLHARGFLQWQSHPDEELDGEGDFMFNEDEVANGTVCMMNVTDIQQMQNGMVAPQDQAALDRYGH